MAVVIVLLESKRCLTSFDRQRVQVILLARMIATLSMEKDLVRKMCLEKVVDEFNGFEKNRRIVLS